MLYVVLAFTRLLNLKQCKSEWSLLNLKPTISHKVTWLKIT